MATRLRSRRRQPDVLEVPPAQLLARVVQLRELLPGTDLPALVQRRPRLLTQVGSYEAAAADTQLSLACRPPRAIIDRMCTL